VFDTGPDDKVSVNDGDDFVILGFGAGVQKNTPFRCRRACFRCEFFGLGGEKGEIVREIGKRGKYRRIFLLSDYIFINCTKKEN
jgi:hypothetical protein